MSIHRTPPKSTRIQSLKSFFAICVALAVPQTVLAQDQEAILKRLEQMEAEVSALRAELTKYKAPAEKGQAAAVKPAVAATASPEPIDESMFKPQTQGAAAAATTQSAEDLEFQKRLKELGQFGITYRSEGVRLGGMRLGAYGESVFGSQDDGGGWKSGFDAQRLVLLGTYALTDNILFNTEIEFEHGGIAADEDDKLGGAVEVEQLFIDFIANDHFAWRSFGVDVVPVGYINLFHEPTQYYSTNRPEIYDALIPSTWYAPSTSAYGKIVDGLNYQLQVSSGLEDSEATANDDGDVPQGGYSAGISGNDGLDYAKAPIGDNKQVSDNLGYALRLSYTPRFIPGFSGSTSVYYTNDTTPRGAYGTNLDHTTRPLGGSDLILYDTEFRYRPPETGFELRSEFVQINFGNTNNLRANNDTDATNNVGNDMYGYSFEGAYHYDFSSSDVTPWEFVPFYRFSKIDLQTSGVGGTDLNDPTGANDMTYHTFGAALFPTREVVLKADYQIVQDKDPETSNQKAFLGSVGFFF